MTVNFKSKVTSNNTNTAYVSKIADDEKTSKLKLNDTSNQSGVAVENIQKVVNQVMDTSGETEEDANRKVYSSNNIISDGDDRKVSIGKLDQASKDNTDLISGNTGAIQAITDSKGEIDGIAELDSSGKVPLDQLPNGVKTLKGNWDANANTPTLADSTFSQFNSTVLVAATPTAFIVDADFSGTDGNIILLNFDGILDIDAIIALWNIANPENTATLSSGAGSDIPDNGEAMQLIGGTDTGNVGWCYNVKVSGTQDLGSGALTYNINDSVILNSDGQWYKQDTTDEVTSVHGRVGAIVSANSDYNADQVDETDTRKFAIKHNRDSSVDPTVSDDSSIFYSIGSKWNNSTLQKEYILQDATAGAAVWVEVGSGGAGEIATIADIDAKTDNTKTITPLGLAGSQLQTDVDTNTAKQTRHATTDSLTEGIDNLYTQVDTKNNLDNTLLYPRKEGKFYYASDEDKTYSDDGTTLNEIGAGVVVATTTDIDAKTDNTKVITPLGLAGSQLQTDVDVNNAKITRHTDTDSLPESATNFYSILHERNAVIAPTANDDSSDGFVVGSTWFDSVGIKKYVLQDATAAAAAWVEIGSGGANVTLSNLTSPTSFNADLWPDATNFRNVGDNTLKWLRGYFRALVQVGISSADNVGLQQGFNTPSNILSNGLRSMSLTQILSIFTLDRATTIDSQLITIETGNTVDGNSGKIDIRTGIPTGTGIRGEIVLKTDADKSKLEVQPTGADNLAIATTKYVNDNIYTPPTTSAPTSYYQSTFQGITTGGTGEVINFEQQDYDDDALVTTGVNWQYEVPTTGKYRINASGALTGLDDGEFLRLYVFIGGVVNTLLAENKSSSAASNVSCGGQRTLSLTALDIITIKMAHDHGSVLNTDTSLNQVRVEIERIE